MDERSGRSYLPRPMFEKLPLGRWRLLWFGNLRGSAENLSGYEIKSYFEWAASGNRDPIEVWLPLTALHLLPLQSVWEQKTFCSFGESERRKFSVVTAGASLHAPWTPGQSQKNLFTTADYRFYGKKELAPCWVFDTESGDKLVVPAWEILRAWYFFDPSVTPAVLAGLQHGESLPLKLRPWREDTGLTPEGTWQYVVPRWLRADLIKPMARLLLDRVASHHAYDIYRQLMQATHSSRPPPDEVSWPAVPPPYEGVGTWDVHCRALSSKADAPRRWLVTRIAGASIPDPIHQVHFKKPNNKQGVNKDEDLPTSTWYSPAKVKHDSPDPLAVTGGAPDAALEEVTFYDFGFRDGIQETLELVPVEKLLQVTRGLHIPSDAATITGAASDPSGKKRASQSGYRAGEAVETLPPVDLLNRTLDAFKMLIAQAGTENETAPRWSARIISDRDRDTICVENKKRKTRRHFAILEMRVGERYVYVIDAQRAGSKKFTLMMCRAVGDWRCSLYMFQSWLSKFPAGAGCPWLGEEIAPRELHFKTLKHQSDVGKVDAEKVTAKLADRLFREITAFS